MLTKEDEELVAVTQITQSPRQQTPLMSDVVQGSIMENSKNAVKASSRSQTPSLSHLHSSSVIDITDDAQATVHRESSEAVSALLASQKAESTALSPYLPLNPSPVSSPPVAPSPSPSEGGRRMETEPPMQQQGILGGGITAAKSLSSKLEFAPSEIIRPVTSMAENVMLVEKEKNILPHHLHHHHHQQQQQQQHKF